jgi:hypothetical protein
MAAKVKMLKLLNEMRGFPQVSNRCPQSRIPSQVLAQFKSPVIQAPPPRRRLSIATDQQDQVGIPHPVKINHVRADSDPAASLSAQ